MLVIPHQKLLNSITNILLKNNFSVFPFISFSVIPPSLIDYVNIFVWDIESVDIYSEEYVDKVKAKNNIKFILTDFLNDKFIIDLAENNMIDENSYTGSYKLRDLINMVKSIKNHQKLSKIENYLLKPSVIFSRKVKDCDNYIEEVQNIILDFLRDNDIEKYIKDIDVFMLGVGEIVENFVENHILRKKIEPNILIEYGFDSEKFIFCVKDFFGDAELSSLFSSFIRRAKNKNQKNELNTDVYFGPRGRGIMIMKKGFDRIITVVNRNSDKKFTEFITVVYFNKVKEDINSSINMLVFE